MYHFDIKKVERPDGDQLVGKIIPAWETRFQELGHTVGQCYQCQTDPSIIYINIPKCASSFMKREVTKLGWQPRFLRLGPRPVTNEVEMLDIDSINKIIVILRDPYSRWLTGIGEYFKLYFEQEEVFGYLDHPLTLEILANQITFDDHTMSQLYFLQNVPLEKCVFFKQDHNLNLKLFAYFHDILGIENTIIAAHPMHVSKQFTFNARVKQHLEKLLRSNSAIYTKIQNSLVKDFEFTEDLVSYWGD